MLYVAFVGAINLPKVTVCHHLFVRIAKRKLNPSRANCTNSMNLLKDSFSKFHYK